MSTTFAQRAWSAIMVLLFIGAQAYGYSNSHSYRASFFTGEPRLSKDLLGTIELRAAGGSASTGKTVDHEKTNILGIYGAQNMHQLGRGVPNQTITHSLDVILNNLWRLPASTNFGTLNFTGKCTSYEIELEWLQNFQYGFFLDVYIPLKKIKVNNIAYTDNTPTGTAYPNISSVEWVQFLANFDNILSRYNLSRDATSQGGAGDAVVLLGWTHNDATIDYFDYLDVSVRLGLLLPTGKKKDEDKAFSIPLGYNGHWGFPMRFDLALGMYNWLTIGTSIDGTFFFKDTKNIRMNTAKRQNGFFKLAKGRAKVDRGSLWNVSTYLKADHVIHGFSLLFGYTYSHQDADHLIPVDTTVFDSTVANSDSLRHSWKSHTLHLLAEYDFAEEDNTFSPRIGVFYDRPIGGKRIFSMDMGGGYAGLEMAINF